MEALKDKVNILLVQLLPDDNKEGEKVEIEDNLIAHNDEAERRRLSESEEDIPSADAKEDSPITEDGKEEEEEEEEEDDDEEKGPSHPVLNLSPKSDSNPE